MLLKRLSVKLQLIQFSNKTNNENFLIFNSNANYFLKLPLRVSQCNCSKLRNILKVLNANLFPSALSWKKLRHNPIPFISFGKLWFELSTYSENKLACRTGLSWLTRPFGKREDCYFVYLGLQRVRYHSNSLRSDFEKNMNIFYMKSSRYLKNAVWKPILLLTSLFDGYVGCRNFRQSLTSKPFGAIGWQVLVRAYVQRKGFIPLWRIGSVRQGLAST